MQTGHSRSGDLQFVLTLSEATDRAVRVRVATQEGTAEIVDDDTPVDEVAEQFFGQAASVGIARSDAFRTRCPAVR